MSSSSWNGEIRVCKLPTYDLAEPTSPMLRLSSLGAPAPLRLNLLKSSFRRLSSHCSADQLPADLHYLVYFLAQASSKFLLIFSVADIFPVLSFQVIIRHPGY